MVQNDKTAVLAKKRGFHTIELVSRAVLIILMKFWRICTSLVLILLLSYWLYGGILVFFLLIMAILGLIYHSQDYLLYHPDQPSNAKLYVELPNILGLPFENVFTRTCDGVLINMYLIKQPEPISKNAPTVIFFHGNAGNIGHRLLNVKAFYTYTGVNILLVEYRGYGRSCGTPSETGFTIDAKTAFEYLLKRSDIDPNKIAIFGRSLGGAVAIQLAFYMQQVNPVYCLLVENTFTSIPQIAMQLFNVRLLACLPMLFYKNQFLSSKKLQHIQIPTLFISGLNDTLIPPFMMQELYESSGSCMKRLARFEQGTHNETWQCPGYYETINRFFQEVNDLQKYNTLPAAVNYDVKIPFDDKGLHIL